MPEARLMVTAPGLIEQACNQTEVFGSITWLWMHSSWHKGMPIHALAALLLPAIRLRQFVLAFEEGRPVFYVSWANLSADAETRYLAHNPVDMPESDWNSGDRMWILDWVAPFGHTRQASQLLDRQLFANRWARTLYHRGDQRGLKIKTFRGRAVVPEEASLWFSNHPIQFPKTHS